MILKAVNHAMNLTESIEQKNIPGPMISPMILQVRISLSRLCSLEDLAGIEDGQTNALQSWHDPAHRITGIVCNVVTINHGGFLAQSTSFILTVNDICCWFANILK